MSNWNRTLNKPELIDYGAVMAPGSFQINGTSSPLEAENEGDIISGQVERVSAGKFKVTCTEIPKVGLHVAAGFDRITADNVDIYCQVDDTNLTVDGTFVIKCKTATTNTDPPDDSRIGFCVYGKKTDRRAG